ncbi:hypothetical protein AURDEDRAFT_162293 [Auricularia subglabra TFB-10046 SS5]|nr:hypothetical protein AURDEDRAFT_162293 [Auricularia subglabra TFB-10046 SS5]
MYDRNRRLLWLALGLFVSICILQGIINGIQVHTSISVDPGKGACVYEALLPRIPLLLWSVYQMLGIVLLLVKIRQARERDKLIHPRVSILTLLARGNLMCYVVGMVALLVGTTLAFRGQSESVADTYYRIQRFASIICAIVATHLFRDMRKMLAPGGRDPTFGSITTLYE